MVDSVISVRMPSSLVQRLKELSKENHFIDLSEEVRSIIKIKIKNYTAEVAEKAEQVQKPADFKTENIVKEEVVKRLKKMIKELEHD